MNEIPLLRAPVKPVTYRCYRCPATFYHRDAFEAHDAACLQRCIESDARKQAMREGL